LDFPQTRTDWRRIAIVVAAIVLTSAAHYLTPRSLLLWHNVFQKLYYLPIIFAAISFGWRGGIGAAIFAGVCYIPHILTAWQQYHSYAINQYADVVIFFLVGLVTGLLADREQKRKRELERSTQQLSEVYRELQESFEQIKRADRLSAIGQLAASLAHEIRNPLASIEGAAGILKENSSTAEIREEFLGIIIKECRRLNRLLTNLLEFARPRRPEYQGVEVARLVDSVLVLVGHLADKTGITLRSTSASELPLLQCDPEQLKQVLLNLLINAIQAMPDGGEVEVISARCDSHISIQIRDQGRGIQAEDLEKIFDPFFTTKESGTGLGLSVAHQIISHHGGAIKVERNSDRGMTFTVLLPLRTGNTK
jgi:two-component system sensor histidine kinase HydH